jgi:uncharacterized membrane protein YqjE
VAQGIPIDPDKGINDLIRQLAEDSKRVASDEVRLAKMEIAESVHEAGKGAMWLGVAFGASVMMLVGLTLVIATFFGRVSNHMWVGALLAAAIDVAAGLWLVQRGLKSFRAAPYSIPETRGGLRVIRNG